MNFLLQKTLKTKIKHQKQTIKRWIIPEMLHMDFMHISVSSHIPRKNKLSGNLQLLPNHFIGRKNGVASLLVPRPILNLALASAVPLALAPGTSLWCRLPTFRTLGRNKYYLCLYMLFKLDSHNYTDYNELNEYLLGKFNIPAFQHRIIHWLSVFHTKCLTSSLFLKFSR